MNRSSVALIVEDNWAELRKLERCFANNTAMGAICIDSLRQAADVVESGNYDISAVVADLRIDREKGDDKRALHDGISFLDWLRRQKSHRSISAYVHSVDGANEAVQSRARSAWGKHIRFFQKSPVRDNDTNSPWACIERDYVVKALSNDSAIQQRLKDSGENVSDVAMRFSTEEKLAERVRNALDAHRVSYISTFPPEKQYTGFFCKRPIEILCRRERRGGEIVCTARSISIGLLVTAEGDTMFDAIEDLRSYIVAEYRAMQKHNKEEIVGYAAHIWRQLQDYVGFDKRGVRRGANRK